MIFYSMIMFKENGFTVLGNQNSSKHGSHQSPNNSSAEQFCWAASLWKPESKKNIKSLLVVLEVAEKKKIQARWWTWKCSFKNMSVCKQEIFPFSLDKT